MQTGQNWSIPHVQLSHLCTCITLHIEHLYNYTCKYVYDIPDKLF